MVLMPKRTKHRKMQKGQMRGLSKGANFVHFGEFGIQALDRGWVTSKQIEACRVSINRYFARRGKVWIRIFPDKPITKKPAEVRMGKGKGNVEYWVAVVKPGRVMFEVGGLPEDVSKEALNLASYKLSIKTKIITRRELAGE